MKKNKVTSGSCLCGKVSYEFSGNLGIFQYCHCSRCRKFTGSAFASNILVALDDFKWITGNELVGRFEPEETKHFATSFCKNCGSTIFLRLNVFQGMVAIPGGSFDPPTFWFVPQVENFCRTKAPFIETSTSEKHDTHPMYNPKKPDNHPVK